MGQGLNQQAEWDRQVDCLPPTGSKKDTMGELCLTLRTERPLLSKSLLLTPLWSSWALALLHRRLCYPMKGALPNSTHC